MLDYDSNLGNYRDLYTGSKNRMKKFCFEIWNEILSGVVEPSLKTILMEGGFIAGGCFRYFIQDTPDRIPDIDIYFRDEEFASLLKNIYELNFSYGNEKMLLTDRTILRVKSSTENALTLVLKPSELFREKWGEYLPNGKEILVQFVTRFSGEPKYVVSKFDFTHSQAYWCPLQNLLYAPLDTLESIENQEMIFNPECYSAVASLSRVTKFAKRGYTIDTENLYKMMLAIRKQSDEEIVEFERTGKIFY